MNDNLKIITLSEEDYQMLISAIERLPKPNEHLIKLFKNTLPDYAMNGSNYSEIYTDGFIAGAQWMKDIGKIIPLDLL